MKRPADQTGFYRKPEEELYEAEGRAFTGVVLFVLLTVVVVLLSGCASPNPIIGECIDGRVTWSDGTTERCKILTAKGSV